MSNPQNTSPVPVEAEAVKASANLRKVPFAIPVEVAQVYLLEVRIFVSLKIASLAIVQLEEHLFK